MKVYVIQRKNGIVIKLGVMIVVYVKKIICGILAHVTVIVKNHVKLMNIQILKIVPPKKDLFGKLTLTCEDEILNKTKTSLDGKKVTCKKAVALFTIFH